MKIIKKTLDIGSILQSANSSRQYKVISEYTNISGSQIIVYQMINKDGTLDAFQNRSTRQGIEEGIKSNKIKLI